MDCSDLQKKLWNIFVRGSFVLIFEKIDRLFVVGVVFFSR